MTRREVYLDNENTTQVAKEVIEAMLPYFSEHGYGHPAIVHTRGREALEALESSREIIARSIGAEPEEIVFTSGGTECNNLALKGVAYANRARGNHILTTKIEHPSVLTPLEDLAEEGFKIDHLSVDHEGFIDLNELREKITEKTILVSIMYVNHEIGTIEPIREVAEILSEFDHKIYLHTDAVEAYTKVPIDVRKLNVDLLSLSSHKIHGPKGVGALYVRRGVKIKPIIRGAISTMALRPGIENIPAIVGFSKAVELAFERFDENVAKMRRLRDKLLKGILDNIPHVLVNGPMGDKRSPANINTSFLYVEGESVTLMLDSYGVYATSSSACTTRELEPSHVLLAIGRKHEEAHGSVMFTLSRYNTEEEIDYVLEVLPSVVEKLRQMSPWKPSG